MCFNGDIDVHERLEGPLLWHYHNLTQERLQDEMNKFQKNNEHVIAAIKQRYEEARLELERIADEERYAADPQEKVLDDECMADWDRQVAAEERAQARTDAFVRSVNKYTKEREAYEALRPSLRHSTAAPTWVNPNDADGDTDAADAAEAKDAAAESPPDESELEETTREVVQGNQEPASMVRQCCIFFPTAGPRLHRFWRIN